MRPKINATLLWKPEIANVTAKPEITISLELRRESIANFPQSVPVISETVFKIGQYLAKIWTKV